jgi:hypothetical protein
MSASSATAALSVLTPLAAHDALAASASDELTARGSFSFDPRLLPTPQAQRSVLRL